MKNLIHTMKAPSKKERGATMVEYVFMVSLIALVSILAVGTLGNTVENMFDTVKY